MEEFFEAGAEAAKAMNAMIFGGPDSFRSKEKAFIEELVQFIAVGVAIVEMVLRQKHGGVSRGTGEVPE